jgi:hypothetical protein
MRRKKTTSNAGKRKQEKNSADNRDSLPAAGGELRRIKNGDHPALTTNQSAGLSDNKDSLGTDSRSPTILEDFILTYEVKL